MTKAHQTEPAAVDALATLSRDEMLAAQQTLWSRQTANAASHATVAVVAAATSAGRALRQVAGDLPNSSVNQRVNELTVE